MNTFKHLQIPSIIIFGPPASGKGTQGAFLSRDFGVTSVVLGNLLRSEISAQTELGNNIKDILDRGCLVDDSIANKVFKNFLNSTLNSFHAQKECDKDSENDFDPICMKAKNIDLYGCAQNLNLETKRECNLDKNILNGFLFDGYPRTIGQAEFISETLKKVGNTNVSIVINLVVDNDELLRRAISRRICNFCNSPIPMSEAACHICGSSDFKIRSDDNANVFESRLNMYSEKTKPVLDYYNSIGIVYNVDGNSGSIDDIYSKIRKRVASFF